MVWFNISQDNSGGWLNEQITQNLHAEVINGLAEPCKSAAEALLCKYAFPDCTLKEGIAVGLPLCQEDCMALRNHYCYKDWALIEDNKRRNVYIKSRGHFRLPVCEDLPKYSNSSKTCTKSSITTMRWDLATSKFILAKLPDSRDKPCLSTFQPIVSKAMVGSIKATKITLNQACSVKNGSPMSLICKPCPVEYFQK